MDYKELLSYQQSLLGYALTEAIRRNEEQFKVWTIYKQGHEKVKEGLGTLSSEISINCMVPIGKRALMKGKLVHTNEILVSLGSDYFAKYSAAGASAVCDRRIKLANEKLQNLQAERNLYEARQIIPSKMNVFGEDITNELVEYCEDKELEEWRVLHRQKEKEYRQKMSLSRSQGEDDSNIDKELFQRLDELELEEELAENDSSDNSEENVVYDESEDDDSLTESSVEEAIYEGNPNENNDTSMSKIAEDRTECKSESENVNNFEKSSILNELSITESLVEKSYPNKLASNLNSTCELPNANNENSKDANKKKKVAFTETCLGYPNFESSITNENTKSFEKEVDSNNSIFHTEMVMDDEEDVIRISFKHSSNSPVITESLTNTVESPKDIYKLFAAPKSILKKSPYGTVNAQVIPPVDEYSTDEEDDKHEVQVSVYKTIVKDIRERQVSDEFQPDLTQIPESKSYGRPISKFKLARLNKNIVS